MITIIEHGKTHFEKTCSRCGCKFSYDLEDLSYVDTLHCPECDNKLYHSTPYTNAGTIDISGTGELMDIRYNNDYEKTNVHTYYNPSTGVEI